MKFKRSLFFFLMLLPHYLSCQEASSLQQKAVTLDLFRVFQGSPTIYVLLIVMSIFSMVLWVYSLFTWRLQDMMPENFVAQVRALFTEKRYEAALQTCRKTPHVSAQIIASGIIARQHGHQAIIDTMESEGKRIASALWQRISLLNDVAVVAPMFGLLGTVIGMFYAFYDTNHSTDNLASIFDGLGVAVGTTVAGLIVAILAMVFYATLKFRVVQLLNTIENETLALATLIDHTHQTND